MKNISILFPKSRFSPLQLERLAGLGKVSFIESVSISSSVDCPKDTEILVFSPGMVDIVARVRYKLTRLLDSLPNIKYLVLGNSDHSFVDLDYCKQKGIIVSHVLSYDVASKSEHIIALLLGSVRRIFINDRRTYKRRYFPELGHNFKGRVLGIVGFDHVGEKVAELAKALGATVYVYDEKKMHIEEAQRKTLSTLLTDSDMITLHLPEGEQYKKFLNKERIDRLKEGVVVVNTGVRDWIDERAMNEALTTRKVDTFAFQAESMGKSPLRDNEFALMFKPYSTNTKETLEKNTEAMVTNIEGIVRGLPYKQVEL